MKGKCDCCGEETKVIGFTDHPDYHDGYYCKDCAPIRRDRRLEPENLEARIDALEERLSQLEMRCQG